MPDGSTLLRFDAILSSVGESGTTRWNARYDVVASGGAVADIDIQLDGSGPGSEQLIDFFDPDLTDLGFERKNSTGSDTTEVHLDLLWLPRYGAPLRIEASDNGIESVEVQLDIELEPNDFQLALPTE